MLAIVRIALRRLYTFLVAALLILPPAGRTLVINDPQLYSCPEESRWQSPPYLCHPRCPGRIDADLQHRTRRDPVGQPSSAVRIAGR